MSAFVIRDLEDAREMLVLEELQRAAWGYPELEVHPSNIFKIHAHTGGVVAAAYDPDDRALGFVFGFPAYRDGRLWHHSHMLAVRPGARGSGLAEALKLHQRARVLGQNLDRITWTFDPLVARNARFNLGKLGARAVSYHPNWYAAEDVPADRLMIEWDLKKAPVPHPPPAPMGQVVLTASGVGPDTPTLDLDDPVLLAEVPTQAPELRLSDRLAWRLALREVLSGYLGRGYAVADLAREGERAFYVLERGAGP